MLHKLPDGYSVGFLEAITDVIPLCFGSVFAETVSTCNVMHSMKESHVLLLGVL